MSGWDEKIDAAMAAKAARLAKEQQERDDLKALKDGQQEAITDFIAKVLKPGLERVKAELEQPGRDREVEVRDSGPNSVTISVRDPSQGWMKTGELYIRFGFEVGVPPATWVRLDSDLGIGDSWRGISALSGGLDEFDPQKIYDGVMANWVEAVMNGRGSA